MVHPGCLASALFCGLWRQEGKKDGQVVCEQSQSSADVITGVTVGHSRMPLEIQPSLPFVWALGDSSGSTSAPPHQVINQSCKITPSYCG